MVYITEHEDVSIFVYVRITVIGSHSLESKCVVSVKIDGVVLYV